MTSKIILLTICFFLFGCSSEIEIQKKKIISILNSNVIDKQYYYFEGNGFFSIKNEKKSREQN